MTRFQSRFFNWIDQSLPAKLGRRARQMLDRQFSQISNFQELPRLLAYQVAKAALYPVYLIASTAKRSFPALNGNKADTGDDTERNLRSQPDSSELLPEADAIVKSFKSVIEQDPPLEIPLFLRPLVKFLSWIDRTKINLDRNINAIIKRQPDNLTTSTSSELNSGLNSEYASRLLANRLFAEIWEQRSERRESGQGEREQNSLRENNGLAESVALGKNTRLEQLRRLIEAAIDYFIGKRSLGSDDDTSNITPSAEAWLTMEEVFGDDNGPWPLSLEYESHAFAKSSDMGVLNSTGELQNFETTTSQISQDRLEGSLLFGGEFGKEFEEELLYQEQNIGANSDRPLRAWIEANVTILGYTYNPVMTVILWIDAIVLKLENGFIALWRAVVNFPKQLVHFIRYGNK